MRKELAEMILKFWNFGITIIGIFGLYLMIEVIIHPSMTRLQRIAYGIIGSVWLALYFFGSVFFGFAYLKELATIASIVAGLILSYRLIVRLLKTRQYEID